MTPEKLSLVLSTYERTIQTFAKRRVEIAPAVFDPTEAKPRDALQGLASALKICAMVKEGMADPLFEAAAEMPVYVRLLGFVEGILWTNGLLSISAMKKIRN